MPFLRAKACHEACVARIQNYLERENRALARDFINIGGTDRNVWADVMDRRRRVANNDLPWRGLAAVTYHHFVVSPDPKDGVGLDELRDYVTAWAQEFFGHVGQFGETYPGKLGNYHVAIVYHDDNASGVPHAHVIVNSTDVDSSARLHIDDKQNEELYVRAQELAAERGWSCFEQKTNEQSRSAFSRVVTRERFLTKEERSLRRSGLFSWKQDLAEHVHLARRSAQTEAEFVDVLRSIGVGVRLNKAGNDYVFAHPANPRLWASSGYRLGKSFSKEAIGSLIEQNHARSFAPDKWTASGATLVADADRLTVRANLAHDASLGRPRSSSVRENIIRAALSDLPDPFACTYGSLAAHGQTVVSLNHVLAVNDREWIHCAADYGRVREMLTLRLEGLENVSELAEVRHEYEARLADLEVAQGVSLRLGVFSGVADTKEWSGPSAFTPLQPKGGAQSQSSAAKKQAEQRSRFINQPVHTRPKAKGR